MRSTASLTHAALAICVLLALTACASQPRISSDYDRQTDFSQFSTYGFFHPMSIEDANYTTLLGQTFREAISREMEARGYVQSDKPDLLINVSAHLQDKVQVTQTPTPAHGPYGTGYYGYRSGVYRPWTGYGWDTQTTVNQYTEGTVNIDMVDATHRRMVWEGVAIGRLKENRSSEQVRAAINEGVARMFAEFPFRAGE